MKSLQFFSAIFLTAIMASQCRAQSDFAPSNWTPPKTGIDVNNQSQLSFPAAPHFDPQVAAANFESSTDYQTNEFGFPDQNDYADEGSSAPGILETVLGNEGWLDKAKAFVQQSDLGRMLGSLSLVLGLYFGFVWVMRKLNLAGPRQIPNEVVEVIGNKPFGPKQNLQLVRLGSKLLLLMNSPEGTHPIGEITEPSEVDYLVSLCSGKPQKRPIPSIQPKASPAPPAIPDNQNQQPTRLSDVLRLLENSTGANFEA